jgi:hypothetical protein
MPVAMKHDVTSPETMRELQGDIVLIVIGGEEFLYTIVRFMDSKTGRLQLSNRSDKGGEHLDLTQAVMDSMKPIKHEQAKWRLEL